MTIVIQSGVLRPPKFPTIEVSPARRDLLFTPTAPSLFIPKLITPTRKDLVLSRFAPTVGNSTIDDGLANAPSGVSAQFPSTFNPYSFRPSWNVAGVEYGVGIPAGTTLKNPASDTLPSGVTRDSVSKWLVVTGNDVTLDSWDMSVDGGWSIKGGRSSGSGSARTNITKCKFIVGALNQMPIEIWGIDNASSTAQDCTITYCTFDGGGATRDLGGRSLIEVSRSGLITMKYCYLHDAATDFMNFGADFISSGRATSIDARFNVFYNNGQDPDGHSDWLQTAEVNSGTEGKLYDIIDYKYNLFIQDFFPGPNGGTQGLTLDANGKTLYTSFNGGTIANNVFICTATGGDGQSYFTRTSMERTNGTWNINNNYCDPGQLNNEPFEIGSGETGPYSGAQVTTGNIDMRDGSSIVNNS